MDNHCRTRLIHGSDGGGGACRLPCQLPRRIRDERIRAHIPCRAPAATVVRIPLTSRPRRPVFNDYHRFHDGRDWRFPLSAATDGSHGDALARFPLAVMDRLAHGHGDVHRPSAVRACALAEHICAKQTEWATNRGEDKRGQPFRGIPAGHPRDEGIQPCWRAFCPPARCFRPSAPRSHPSGSIARSLRVAEHRPRPCRTYANGALRCLSHAGWSAFRAHFRPVPHCRLARVRPAHFCTDQLCRVPLFLHRGRSHPLADA